MRLGQQSTRLPAFVLAAAMVAASPAYAADIVFVPGTGAPSDIADEDSEIAVMDDVASPNSEAKMREMAERLDDPAMQDSIAEMAEGMGNMLLKLPIGKFAHAIEKARPGTVGRGISEKATVADMAGRDAEDLPEELGEQSRVAMKMMSGFAGAFASMMPELEKLGRDLEESMADMKAKPR
jgi:hypothetical protein